MKIRTQDNREYWRLKSMDRYKAVPRRGPWPVLLGRWRPSILWRIRRLLGVS